MAALLAPAALAQTPSLTILDRPPGRLNTFVSGISADGRAITGYSTGEGISSASYVWHAATGYNEFGVGLGGPAGNRANAISADGSVVVGMASITLQTTGAFRYAGGVYTTLPFPAGYNSAGATGASHDGSVVVGSMSGQGFFSRAMRWTQDGGMVDIGRARPGDISTGFTGISPSGATALGRSSGGGAFDAYTWSQSSGWQLLPAPAGMTGEYDARPTMTNDDGSVVVGTVRTGVIDQRDTAVLWVDHQPTSLGTFGSQWMMSAIGVSSDRSIVAGSARNLDSPIPEFYQATVWLNGGGPTLLTDYLLTLGVSVPSGWTLEGGGVTPDGRTLWGSAAFRGPGVLYRTPYVVTIPAPGVVSLGVIAMAFARRRRRRV